MRYTIIDHDVWLEGEKYRLLADGDNLRECLESAILDGKDIDYRPIYDLPYTFVQACEYHIAQKFVKDLVK